MNKNIVLGCDNAAVDFKNTLGEFLTTKGYDIEDIGVHSTSDATPYPTIASKMAELLIRDNFTRRGILICGTGIGMAMAANKFPGIRAAQVHDSFSAERAALSNDANIITMGARIIGIQLAKKLALEWLGLHFIPCASSKKIAAIRSIELSNFKNKNHITD